MPARPVVFVVALIEGLAVGVLISILDLVVLREVSDQLVLLCGYAVVVLLVSASLTSSAKAGFLLAVFTVIGATVIGLIYYGGDLLLAPYAVGFYLFVGRIPLFPIAGALGGYLGKRYFTKEAEGKGKREKSRKRRNRG